MPRFTRRHVACRVVIVTNNWLHSYLIDSVERMVMRWR